MNKFWSDAENHRDFRKYIQITFMAHQHPTSPWEGVVSGTTAAILANVIVYPVDMYGYQWLK